MQGSLSADFGECKISQSRQSRNFYIRGSPRAEPLLRTQRRTVPTPYDSNDSHPATMTTTSMPTNPEYQASDAAPPPSPPLDSRLVHDTKNLLATFHHRRSQLPDEQRIYIVAYGSAVPPPPESPPKPRKKRAAKKQKKNATTGTLDEPMVIDSTPELPPSPPQAPEPEVPRDQEQYVLLRREYTGVGRDTR